MRLALGARRLQIVRQLFSESIVLCLLAGVLGVALAYVSFGAIVSLAPIDVPRLEEAAIDMRALLFALVLCLGTAVIVGLFPAWRHSGGAPVAGLYGRSRTSTSSTARARKLLVALQLAAVVVLLTAAGLFIRSFTALLRLDLGFDPRGVLTFNLGFSEEKYETKEKQWALTDAVLDSARRLPGAIAAGAVLQRPFANGVIGMDTNVIIEGQPLASESASRNPILNWEVATPDYFRAMDIRLLQGRLFDERDTAQSPLVVVVGQSLAARLWPGRDPIGKRMLTVVEDGKPPAWQTVVGVVEDARYREVETPRFDLYLAYRQSPNPVQHVMVRLSGDPLAAVPALRNAVATLNPDERSTESQRWSRSSAAHSRRGGSAASSSRGSRRWPWRSLRLECRTGGLRGDAARPRDRRSSGPRRAASRRACWSPVKACGLRSRALPWAFSPRGFCGGRSSQCCSASRPTMRSCSRAFRCCSHS